MVDCTLLSLKLDQELLTISQSHTTNGNTSYDIRVAATLHLLFPGFPIVSPLYYLYYYYFLK